MLKKFISSALMAGTMLSFSVQAVNKALLIGVGEYQGTENDLEGPKYDVAALKKVLQERWEFKANNITTLLDYDASRSNILKALAQLTSEAKADDQILIYFSGHGTSVRDPKFKSLNLPYSSGALIPQDFSTSGTPRQMYDQLIVGARDLRPILLALDKTQANIFAVVDSCYSGNSVRGLFSGTNSLRSRNMNISVDIEVDNIDDMLDTKDDRGDIAIQVYPYKNIFFLSAANASEVARDLGENDLINLPTFDNKPHGAFTDAFLRALSGELHTDINRDGQTNYSEIHTSIKQFMKTRGYSHEPQVLPALAEDKTLLRMRHVMGKKGFAPIGLNKVSSALLTVHLENNDSDLISKLKQLPHIQLLQKNAELNLKKQSSNYLLINQSGDLIATLIEPDIQQIVGRIKQEAWKKHFNQLLRRRVSINVDFSLVDSIKGSSAIEDELIAFTLRSEKPVHLLLLDVDAYGTLNILYPYSVDELKVIPANQLKFIPGEHKNNWIKVQKPFGVDHLIAIGFAQEPPFLKEFTGKITLNLQSDLYKKLLEYLKTGQYGYNELDLLTVAKK